MSDKIIAKLHQKVAEKVANTTAPLQPQQPVQKTFSDILNQKIGDAQATAGIDPAQNKPQDNEVFQKITDDLMADKRGDMKVIGADDIKVDLTRGEIHKESKTDVKQKFMSLIEDLNSDMLGLDSAVEVLADPNMKLNRRQLLAYQAGIGNMTISMDLCSKLFQVMAQNITTVLNTNIG